MKRFLEGGGYFFNYYLGKFLKYFLKKSPEIHEENFWKSSSGIPGKIPRAIMGKFIGHFFAETRGRIRWNIPERIPSGTSNGNSCIKEKFLKKKNLRHIFKNKSWEISEGISIHSWEDFWENYLTMFLKESRKNP